MGDKRQHKTGETTSADGDPVIILPGKRPSFSARLRNWFLTGIVVAAPIGITILIVKWFVELVDRWFTPLIPVAYRPETYLPFSIPGLGLLVAAGLLTLLGLLTANFVGRRFLRIGEAFVDRMPVVRNLYGALKQIFETVMAQSQTSFRDVALIEYPRKGVYSIAFVTGESKNEIASRVGMPLVSVFLPTTPNPTSGFLLYVPREDITLLDMTIEEAAKLIVSAGLVEPVAASEAEDAPEALHGRPSAPTASPPPGEPPADKP